MIQAHNSPLAAVRFSADGAKVATASEKGTVIRVFSVPNAEKLFEFRRGVKRCVSINSMVFNEDATLLACASNTETVHVFKLDASSAVKSDAVPASPTGGGGWMEYVSKTASAYLPTQMTDMLVQDRAFATCRLPVAATAANHRTQLALTK